MTDRPHDLLILGGGLAGGIIALALAEACPESDVAIVEAAERLGGNHVWSFFDSDLDEAGRTLVAPLVSHRWPGYDVAFPGHRRTLDTPYNSIESEQLDAVVRARVPMIHRGSVVAVEPGQVRLADGGTIAARTILDTRGVGDVALLDGGWQKFVGQVLQLDAPHGLTRPIVMDATVPQLDGYRFVYVLPLGPTTLFVEDTYYSDTPDLDVDTVRARILDYAAARGWQATPGNRIETGVLPVIAAGDFEGYWRSTGAGAKAGMRAALCHPTTGYSLPDAVRLAQRIAAAPDLSQGALDRLTYEHARAAWHARGFYRMLDKMLFRAALPHERYRVLERFYRLHPDLISRFYAASSTFADKARILMGRPPVPLSRAIRAIVS